MACVKKCVCAPTSTRFVLVWGLSVYLLLRCMWVTYAHVIGLLLLSRSSFLYCSTDPLSVDVELEGFSRE